MGACSGKLLEKEYAGYSPTVKTRGSPATIRARGSPSSRNTSKQRTVVTLQTKTVRTRVEENRHGFVIDSNIMLNLKSNEMSALLRLMNHESKEISTFAFEIIKGLSINEFTGAIALTPQAIKNLGTLMGSNCEEVLVNCITVLHSLVQQDEDLTTEIYIACVDKLTLLLQRDAADVLCGAISLLGLMAAVDDILCDMIDKDLHEMLADKFHSTNDVVVKRQIFLALHNFMLINNSEKAMHTKVIKILVETLQMADDIIDPDIRVSALRILSYISMSGSEYLQKIIGELGGIPTLAKLAQSPNRGNSNKELIKISGMALSCLCCVAPLQEQVLYEWRLESILHFFEANMNDSAATLAVVMALNNLLEHSSIKQSLRENTYLKHLLRTAQQKASTEEIMEECTDALGHLLPAKEQRQTHQAKFEKLCMQHFSPFVNAMLRKSQSHRRLPSISPQAHSVPSTKNWLLSPDHSSLSPRRHLFPRKLNLFLSPKHPSPSPPPSGPHSTSPLHNARLHSSPSTPPSRRYSLSADTKITPTYTPTRRNSVSVPYSTSPSPKFGHRNHSHTSPSNYSQLRSPISHSPLAHAQGPSPRNHAAHNSSRMHTSRAPSPIRNVSPATRVPSPRNTSATNHSSRVSLSPQFPASKPCVSSFRVTSPSPNSSITFCSPLPSPAWHPSPVPILSSPSGLTIQP